jgi:hypothetical protein
MLTPTNSLPTAPAAVAWLARVADAILALGDDRARPATDGQTGRVGHNPADLVMVIATTQQVSQRAVIVTASEPETHAGQQHGADSRTGGDYTMSITSTLGRAAGVAAGAAGIAGLSLAGVASASTGPAGAAPSTVRATPPVNPPDRCSIQASNGDYLTAVGGGDRTTDVIHTDATQVQAWEKFTFIDSGDGAPDIHYGIQTTNGHYLTAVGGGDRTTDVIHSDATLLQAWEKFTLVFLGHGRYAIQTIDGHYVTAVGGGGRITDTIHTDATQVGAWEEFHLTCAHRPPPVKSS